MSFKSLFTEADTAEVEISHEATRATTLVTTTNSARRELRRTVSFYDQ